MRIGLGYAQRPDLKRVRVELPRLPARSSPLRVLHLADLHLRGASRDESQILAAVGHPQVDLIACTGDLLLDRTTPGHVALGFLTRLQKQVSATLGMYIVRGNNDHRRAIRTLTQNGFRVLDNESVRFGEGPDAWFLVGVDDPFTRSSDLDLALRDVPQDAFTLLLAHSPDILYAAGRMGVDMVLAGHTHAGQVRFPIFGALFTQTRIPTRFCWGLHHYGGTTIYTTSGAGTSTLPIRVNCPPEVVLLDLVHA